MCERAHVPGRRTGGGGGERKRFSLPSRVTLKHAVVPY